MKNFPRRKMLVVSGRGAIAFSSILALAVLKPCFALPQKQDAGPSTYPERSALKSKVDIQVKMDNDPSLLVGEPVLLRYKIANLSGNAIGTPLNTYRSVWYTLKLVDDQGKEVDLLPALPRLVTPGFQVTSGEVMPPGQTHEGFIVATERFALTRPGKYTLTLSLDMPYANLEDGALIDRRASSLRASGMAVRGIYTFPLTVREGTPDGLAGAANKLRKQFLAATNVDEKRCIAAALFSMPAASTLTVWKRLAYGTSAFDRGLVAKALAQTFKPEAAEVMVKMEFNHPTKDNAGNAVSVMETLAGMSNAGSPKLKQHIQRLLAPYRFNMNSIPGVVD